MAFEEKLIAQIRAHKCIFNLTNKDYKNIFVKDKSWNTISKILDTPVDICKKRWKSLRDTYKRVKQQGILPSGSMVEEPSHRWKYADIMSFLDDVASTRGTIGNTVGSYPSSESEGTVTPEMVVPVAAKKRKRNPDMLENFLEAAENSMEKLCDALSTTTSNTNSTMQLCSSLGTRILRSGLTEEETAEMEEALAEFVFIKLREIKQKRS